MAKAVRIRRPARVRTFGHWLLSQGLPPLLKVSEQRLMRGPFMVATTVTDNTAVSEDLTIQSKWDQGVKNLFGSGSVPIKGVLHLTGVGFYVNDDSFRTETGALKETLDNNLYVHVVRGGKAMDYPLRNCIFENIAAFEFKQTAAADAERSLLRGRMYSLPRPLRVDLETDTLQTICSAINWASGNILGYTVLAGGLAPKDFPGAQVGDMDCADNTEDPLSVADPIKYIELQQSGFSSLRDQDVGGIPMLRSF